MQFSLIKNIIVNDPTTWQDKIFITIDMEWADDDTLLYAVDKIISRESKVTIFCTHNTPLLPKLQNDSRIELGIHPNFNYLLQGDFRYGKNIDEVIAYYKNIVPTACSARSHCFVTGTNLAQAFLNHGIHYDCNILLPAQSTMDVKPWNSFIGKLVHIPTFWEDDVHCMYQWNVKLQDLLLSPSIKIFNFHPVPLLLNIDSMSQYQKCKAFYADHAKLRENRNPSYGVDHFLEELLNAT